MSIDKKTAQQRMFTVRAEVLESLLVVVQRGSTPRHTAQFSKACYPPRPSQIFRFAGN